jgi:hypothetical protein
MIENFIEFLSLSDCFLDKNLSSRNPGGSIGVVPPTWVAALPGPEICPHRFS